MTGLANCQLEGTKSVYKYIHGIYRYFNRQRLESREKLQNEGTKRTNTQVLKIIEKVSETVIHLKVDQE